jgi:hypothetical protein
MELFLSIRIISEFAGHAAFLRDLAAQQGWIQKRSRFWLKVNSQQIEMELATRGSVRELLMQWITMWLMNPTQYGVLPGCAVDANLQILLSTRDVTAQWSNYLGKPAPSATAISQALAGVSEEHRTHERHYRLVKREAIEQYLADTNYIPIDDFRKQLRIVADGCSKQIQSPQGGKVIAGPWK